MRCRSARRRAIEAELGLLGPARALRLARHLARCASCRRVREREERLTGELRALHAEPPFEIDVAARVLGGLRAIAPGERREVRPRELGWAALGAAVGAVAFAWTSWLVLFQTALPARNLTSLATGAWRTAAAGWGAARVVVATAATVAGNLLEAVPVVLRDIEPAGVRAVALGALVMAAAIVLVVGRDLAQGRLAAGGRNG